MGARRGLTALALALAAAGCKTKEEPKPAPAPSSTAAPDQLNGEIPEGRERAYTLPLPLHSEIRARFKDSVHVGVGYSREDVANFIRARVKDGKTTSGAALTRFDNVVVTKDPTKHLTIEVMPAPMTSNFRSQLIISDVTPVPEPPGMTDADRWKQLGLTPEGKPLDPNRLE